MLDYDGAADPPQGAELAEPQEDTLGEAGEGGSESEGFAPPAEGSAGVFGEELSGFESAVLDQALNEARRTAEGGDEAATPPAGPTAHDDGDEVPPVLSEGDYIVSISGHFGFRRLHRLGRCWRIPNKDYKCFTVFGTEAPTELDFDAVCKQCWPSSKQSADTREQVVAQLSRKPTSLPRSTRTTMQRLAAQEASESDESVSAVFTDGTTSAGNMD